MIYKRPNIKNISTTLLLSLLWGTTLSSAAEQELITEDNALGTQHANLPAQGTHRIAANWGEFFNAYQLNMVITHDRENGKAFLYQGASLQAELQSGINDQIKALYLQPDHSVYVNVSEDRDKIRYGQANGIILENIQSGLSRIHKLYPQPDVSFFVWGRDTSGADKLVHVRPGVTNWQEIETGLNSVYIVSLQPDGSIIVLRSDDERADKLLHGRPGVTGWKEINTGLTFIHKVQSQPDGSLFVSGKDASGAAKSFHGRPDEANWQGLETGLSNIIACYPQSDGSLIVRGYDAAGAAKLVHSRPGETKSKEINKSLSYIYNVYPQPDGSLIVHGKDASGAAKLFHGRPDETNWQGLETGLSYIDNVFPQPDGSIIIEGMDDERAVKLVHGRPDGKSWKEINTGLSYIDNVFPQPDGSIIIGGIAAAGGEAVKYINPDRQVQPLLGHRVVKVHQFLNAEPYINYALSNLITAKDELDTSSLQHLCEKLAKFRQKPKDALFLFTKLYDKLVPYFHRPSQANHANTPASESSQDDDVRASHEPGEEDLNTGDNAYGSQENPLGSVFDDLSRKYESTWLSPYLDALYFECCDMRQFIYLADENYKKLTLDQIITESADFKAEDRMHYKNRLKDTERARDILKKMKTDAPELMQQLDFNHLSTKIENAITQLGRTAVSSPTPSDTSMTTTG